MNFQNLILPEISDSKVETPYNWDTQLKNAIINYNLVRGFISYEKPKNVQNNFAYIYREIKEAYSEFRESHQKNESTIEQYCSVLLKLASLNTVATDVTLAYYKKNEAFAKRVLSFWDGVTPEDDATLEIILKSCTKTYFIALHEIALITTALQINKESTNKKIRKETLESSLKILEGIEENEDFENQEQQKIIL